MSEPCMDLTRAREADGDFLVPEESARLLSAQVQQLGRILAAMQRRLDAMEQENARRVTISHAQALQLQKRIRLRAEELCAAYALGDPGDAGAFRAAIKKDLLVRCGVRDLHDLPLYLLDRAVALIGAYSNIGLVMERRRKGAGPPADRGRKGV